MKKERNELEDELRPEYDFATMQGGVRENMRIALSTELTLWF
jgi:hypothetical protein